MKPGDIVLVRFPFSDQKATKQRPAVVLAVRRFGRVEDLCLAMITRNIKNQTSEDVVIDSKHKDFKKTGLDVKSLIRVHRIVTLEDKEVIKKLGSLGDNHKNQLRSSLKRLFSL